MENVAYIILNRFNKPSVYYNIVTHNTDDVSLGDLIKVEVPSTHAALYASNDILTLIGYEITIGQSIRTRLKIGEKLSISVIVFDCTLDSIPPPTT